VCNSSCAADPPPAPEPLDPELPLDALAAAPPAVPLRGAPDPDPALVDPPEPRDGVLESAAAFSSFISACKRATSAFNVAIDWLEPPDVAGVVWVGVVAVVVGALVEHGGVCVTVLPLHGTFAPAALALLVVKLTNSVAPLAPLVDAPVAVPLEDEPDEPLAPEPDPEPPDAPPPVEPSAASIALIRRTPGRNTTWPSVT
jgi:hypothetical protein